MGPERISLSKSKQKTTSVVSHNVTRNQKHLKKMNDRDASMGESFGVQKLKAAVRQTRRLLAKDNLAADVRRDAERRLRSLESDLQTAELRRKEQIMAKRYHKVKFFERKKVLRKIKKVKRELEQGKSLSSKESTIQLKNALFELRLQLNYILNYPVLEKYISLFPPSSERNDQNPDLHDGVDRPPKSETDARREQILSNIRNRMTLGQLSGKPEIEAEGSATRSSTSKSGLQKLEFNGPGDSIASGASAANLPAGLERQRQRERSAKHEITLREAASQEDDDDDFFDVRTNSEESE